ncbi:hypothetical protein B0I37DRAFT_230358 [Chaetomium sp. MPI-CAGE-AT-0009]|nr:hypothetical protein B0I37DRAFT_230358 [Chaetomium sp. MPI-CAGE-AT-0009]
MATVSQTATALTPSPYLWEDGLPGETENFHNEKTQLNEHNLSTSGRPPLTSQNGNSTMRTTTNPDSLPQEYSDEDQGVAGLNPEGLNGIHPPPLDHKEMTPQSIKEHATPENSAEQQDVANGVRPKDTPRKVSGGRSPESDSDENSKWIHRDKLAKIESAELQAAGIFIPRQRDDRARSKSQNRPRRDQSQDKMNGSGRSIGGSEYTVSRSRKNSAATTTDARVFDQPATPSWDLRRPEEILEEGDGHWVTNGNGKGSSRIPVAKISPVPLPNEHLARDTRLARKRDGSPGGEDSITYPKTRTRSGSTGNALGPAGPAKPAGAASTPQPNKRPDSSPKKPGATTTARKPKPASGAAGRPKTRGGPSKDSTSSGNGTTRPSTRSGEREFSSANSKPMEGEPPWMVSAYRPDPRLPPDQQLLPTVAKRLQQEKWEREGKFGSVYDKEFRPLTDEGFLKPPEPGAQDNEAEKEVEPEQKEEQGDWPLKAEPKSPSLPGRTNSYSTMPKISDAPAANSISSPRTPAQQTQPSQTPGVPEPAEEPEEKKAGCGCCIVM